MTALATLRDVGFEEWLGKINTACGRFCAKTLGPGFSGAMQEFRAHALRLSVVDVSQARLYRTPREIARSDGAHFFTVIQLRGSALMEQGDRQTVLSPGDMTLIDASQPSSFTFQRDSRQISCYCRAAACRCRRLARSVWEPSSARCASAASWC